MPTFYVGHRPVLKGRDFQAALSEVAVITRTATGGTVTFTFDGQTTAATPVVAATTAAQVKTALESLSTIDPGDITVSGAAGGPFTVTFTELGDKPNLTVDATNATGGTVTVAVTSGALPDTSDPNTYSYFPLQQRGAMLDGFPDRPSHVPGTGRHPHSTQLSGWFTGALHQTTRMANPGDGARQDPYFNRQQPYLYKGLVSTQALAGPHFGHAHGINGAYARFSNISGYKGVPSGNATLNGGHAQRAYGAGAAFMGPTHKWEYQGVTSRPMDEPGRDYPEGRYGHEKHQEWFGVPSAQAL